MNIPKISKATWIRTISLFIMAANGVLTMLGYQIIPIGEAEVEGAVNAIYAVVSAIGLIVTVLIAWWKDNDFTKKARAKKTTMRQY